MELNPKDVIVTHGYLGPGNGSSIELTHQPTGVSVGDRISAKSGESGHAIQARLLSALKIKIQQGKSNQPVAAAKPISKRSTT